MDGDCLDLNALVQDGEDFLLPSTATSAAYTTTTDNGWTSPLSASTVHSSLVSSTDSLHKLTLGAEGGPSLTIYSIKLIF